MKLRTYILIYSLFVLLSVCSVLSVPIISNQKSIIQNNDSISESFDIKWIGKISSADDLKQKKGFIKKVFEFVAGEDFTGLAKPVNLIALDTSKYIVIDQGIQFPVLIDGNTGNIQNIDNDIKSFPSLVGICKGKDEKIYFTDSKNNQIYYLNNEDDESKILNDSLDLKQPTGVAYSKKNDEIYVSETANHRIVVFDNKGNVKRIIGKRGTAQGEFNFPTYLWIDTKNKIYVVDAMNFRVQIFNDKDEVVSVFGESGDASGYIASPKGIATDSYGHIYLADALLHCVQIFDEKGNFLYYFGSQGSADGEFWMPSGIYIDRNDRIYVADTYNSRIQIFQLLKRK